MREDLSRIVAAARAAGRSSLLETEGLRFAEAIGLSTPRHVLVADAAEAGRLDLSTWSAERVVVKVVSPEIQHKTEVGGVAVVARSAAAVAEAVGRMQERLAVRSVVGFLVCEFVEHEARLGGELLIGARWTEDFGPVVTVGGGGTDAEQIARRLAPGAELAILSPAFGVGSDLGVRLAEAAVVDLAVRSQRGQPPRVDPAQLERVVRRLLDLAEAAMPHDLVELEFNPVAAARGGLWALDALARLGGPRRAAAAPRPLARLDRLLAPRSIALVGVSEKMNPGHVMLCNVLRQGFPAERVFVVKPNAATIEGCRCVPDIASLPERVDLLVVAVDAAQVPEVVREVCRLERAESLILIPGGLGERAGSEGHARAVRDALEAARGTVWGGPLVNGGNCLGIRSRPGRYDTLFIPQQKLGFPGGEPEPLAFLSQSGAFAVARASELDQIEPRYVVTFGNQLDLTVGDYLTYLVEDPELRVFACYVEGFRPGDGRRFLIAARRARELGKTVVLYRAGRTAAGAEAAASHTASIAGDYAVTRALARQAGVRVAATIEDFGDLVRLALGLRDKPLAGRRLGAVTNAGFECVALADNLGPFELARLGPASRDRLAALLDELRLGAIVAVQNPLDLTPIAGDRGYEAAVRAVLDDEGVDLGIVSCVPLTAALNTLPGDGEDLDQPDSVVQRLIRLFRSSAKPWVAVVDGGPRFDPMARSLQAAGIPTFRRADRALRALGQFGELVPGTNSTN
jgi:acyl-CoA synthetase (NDP forming)